MKKKKQNLHTHTHTHTHSHTHTHTHIKKFLTREINRYGYVKHPFRLNTTVIETTASECEIFDTIKFPV